MNKHTGRHAVARVLEEAGYRPATNSSRRSWRSRSWGQGKQVGSIDLQTIADVVIGDVAKAARQWCSGGLCDDREHIPHSYSEPWSGGRRSSGQYWRGPGGHSSQCGAGLLDSDTSIHLCDFRIEAISGGADAWQVVIG